MGTILAMQRLDNSLRDFHHVLDLLREPGHYTQTVHTRPQLAASLQDARNSLRDEADELMRASHDQALAAH